jgi:hypothetical protein
MFAHWMRPLAEKFLASFAKTLAKYVFEPLFITFRGDAGRII